MKRNPVKADTVVSVGYNAEFKGLGSGVPRP